MNCNCKRAACDMRKVLLKRGRYPLWTEVMFHLIALYLGVSFTSAETEEHLLPTNHVHVNKYRAVFN